MRSNLFTAESQPVQSQERFAKQNSRMVRGGLGPDLLAAKGVMVGYRGQLDFHHEKSGSMAKLAKKIVTSEDVSLMRVSGQGEIYLAQDAGYLHFLHLENEGISVNSRNLLAFDASLTWDIKRTKGAGLMTGGFFNTTVGGTGTVVVNVVGKALMLDTSQQPVFVDPNSAVCWSANLAPTINNSMNASSMLRGGSGEALQYAFHGPGFVIVQSYEWKPPPANNKGGGGIVGNAVDLFS